MVSGWHFFNNERKTANRITVFIIVVVLLSAIVTLGYYLNARICQKPLQPKAIIKQKYFFTHLVPTIYSYRNSGKKKVAAKKKDKKK